MKPTFQRLIFLLFSRLHRVRYEFPREGKCMPDWQAVGGGESRGVKGLKKGRTEEPIVWEGMCWCAVLSLSLLKPQPSPPHPGLPVFNQYIPLNSPIRGNGKKKKKFKIYFFPLVSFFLFSDVLLLGRWNEFVFGFFGEGEGRGWTRFLFYVCMYGYMYLYVQVRTINNTWRVSYIWYVHNVMFYLQVSICSFLSLKAEFWKEKETDKLQRETEERFFSHFFFAFFLSFLS